MQIQEAVFVVVDTETTGLKIEAGTDRMTEIAAVKVVGGKVIDQFSQLVNPERHIPRFISHMTGITTATVFDAPAAAEVLPEFLDFLGDGILVAHNFSFDQKVLDMELARANMESLSNPGLCTLRLARRLLTALPSKSLKNLKKHYGIRSRNHRALDDAEATSQVLERLLFLLNFDYSIESLDDLLSFQYQRYDEAKAPKHIRSIRETLLPQLPPRPGVYFFKNNKNNILYIGKAKSLKMRVRSYFSAIDAHPKRIHQLMKTMRHVEWEETGSELGALLLESRLIKTHKPRFNRADRRYRHRPFIRLSAGQDHPNISWRYEILNDGAEYYGPLARRQQAEAMVDLINRLFQLRECDERTFATGPCIYAEMERCLAPCVDKTNTAYADEVDRVRHFLTGQDDTVLETIQEAMHVASAKLDFEEAQWYRDQMRLIERMLTKQQYIAAPVLQHNTVWIEPGIGAGTVQCFLIRFGRLVDTTTLHKPAKSEEIKTLCRLLNQHFNPDQALPDRYRKEEVDEVRVLANWIYAHRNTVRQAPWHPEQDVKAWVTEIMELV